MTMFEELAKECNISITTDKNGLYTGYAKALSIITNEIILSDDNTIFNLPWEKQKTIIKEKFYKTFPYKK